MLTRTLNDEAFESYYKSSIDPEGMDEGDERMILYQSTSSLQSSQYYGSKSLSHQASQKPFFSLKRSSL